MGRMRPVGLTPVGLMPVGASTPVGLTPVGLTPVGLTPVGVTLMPFEVAEPEADELALVGVGVDTVTVGVGLVVGVGVGVGVGVPQGLAVALTASSVSTVVVPVALVSAVAGAVAADCSRSRLPVALAGAGRVVLRWDSCCCWPGWCSCCCWPGWCRAAGLGVVLGTARLSEWDGEGLDGHAVACALSWLLGLLGMLLGVAPPAKSLSGWCSLRPCPGPRCCCCCCCYAAAAVEANPTAEPICTKAWRSGGTARATPMANTAQAAARPDRSSTSRRSRGWRRA